jgi:hypothetical protein
LTSRARSSRTAPSSGKVSPQWGCSNTPQLVYPVNRHEAVGKAPACALEQSSLSMRCGVGRACEWIARVRGVRPATVAAIKRGNCPVATQRVHGNGEQLHRPIRQRQGRRSWRRRILLLLSKMDRSGIHIGRSGVLLHDRKDRAGGSLACPSIAIAEPFLQQARHPRRQFFRHRATSER